MSDSTTDLTDLLIYLHILNFTLDEVHEVVQRGVGRLGRVGDVPLLHTEQQRGGQEAVPEYKLPRRNVDLNCKCNKHREK